MKQGPHRQKGVFSLVAAGVVVALLFFVGIVMDIGRIYALHGQLQNMADACALAAVAELDGTAGAPVRAEKIGQYLINANAISNNVDATATIQFSKSLNDKYYPSASSSIGSSTSSSARVVSCFLYSNKGFGVSLLSPFVADIERYADAEARAGLMPAGRVCALPLAVTSASPHTPLVVRLAEFSGGTLRTNSAYVDEIKSWGECNVPTAKTSTKITVDFARKLGDAAVADIVNALGQRWSDPDCGSTVTCYTPRRRLAVPRVDASGFIQEWVCLEINTALGALIYKGSTHVVGSDLTVPSYSCLTTGVPGAKDGPFVAALLR